LSKIHFSRRDLRFIYRQCLQVEVSQLRVMGSSTGGRGRRDPCKDFVV